MPGEIIDQPNPPPKPSHLPEEVLALTIKPEKAKLDEKTSHGLQAFRRAANYIAAAMIFLHDNVLVERDLKSDDIKPRLLGHWGTCPGITLVYAHINLLVKKHDLKMIYVVGPGHGAPAILSSLWIEGSMERFYPQYARNKKGLYNLISGFSTPSGFPSHINAETPGAIHEGGELGYALAVAFGAVMDKPDQIVTAIIGDGEAESGPTAAAWHAIKYIDPKESGAVIPVLHVNGFKISERTIYGCMDDKEITALFTGYGYKCCIVEDLKNIDAEMAAAMEWALSEIKTIQQAARSGKPIMKPRWPMIVLRTPKGWGGPKKVRGELVEGSFHSHQVPLPAARTDKEELKMLQEWLLSYNPRELFDRDGSVNEHVLETVPRGKLMLGQQLETYGNYEPLEVPDFQSFGVKKGTLASCMQTCGELLDATLVANPTSLRIFSPDELVSNKLDAVFRHTGRNFQWDQYSFASGGRVIEILSEHTCQGFLQGYTMTGRTGLFPSYESFLGIIDTMVIQFSKFAKLARETTWRKPIASLNYIETSTWTRQDHNGFSHQNPAFIGRVLNLKPEAARVYLPPDANTFVSTLAHCLRSKGYVNLMVGSKAPSPVYLSPSEAESHCKAGASIWKFASTDSGYDPDVVIVGVGCEVTFEVVAAAAYLRAKAPHIRIRVVNVTDLMILQHDGAHPHALKPDDWDALFTPDKPVHFNYHGYAHELQGLIFGRDNLNRVSIEAYREEGTTTTPFDMMIRNHVSRFHVAEAAVKGAAQRNDKVRMERQELLTGIRHEISKTREYILKHGNDPEGTYDVPDFKEVGVQTSK
ncbi:MAG: hypothetical protein M1834_000562 [Cirrosporium novae-zelandiae]|nr:MAG: hypothetical protein M1834_000562 [Cirrosporium novae-zelandiae]